MWKHLITLAATVASVAIAMVGTDPKKLKDWHGTINLGSLFAARVLS